MPRRASQRAGKPRALIDADCRSAHAGGEAAAVELVKGIDAVTPVANVHTADIAGATRPAVAAVRVRARVARSHHAVVAEYILTRGTVCKDTFVKRYIDAGIAKLSLAAGAIARHARDVGGWRAAGVHRAVWPDELEEGAASAEDRHW